MVLAVEARDPHVDDREAVDAAGAIVSSMPFSTAGMNCRGDGAADDLVDELEALAAVERLDAESRDAELAVAAGLLLVLALGLGLLR